MSEFFQLPSQIFNQRHPVKEHINGPYQFEILMQKYIQLHDSKFPILNIHFILQQINVFTYQRFNEVMIKVVFPKSSYEEKLDIILPAKT